MAHNSYGDRQISKRHTSSKINRKRLKFKGHHKLEKYRYLIHVDSYPSRLNLLIKWLKNGLIQFVKAHPEKSLFISQHPERQTIQEEVNILKKNWFVDTATT